MGHTLSRFFLEDGWLRHNEALVMHLMHMEKPIVKSSMALWDACHVSVRKPNLLLHRKNAGRVPIFDQLLTTWNWSQAEQEISQPIPQYVD